MSEIVYACIISLNRIGQGFCEHAAGMFIQASLLVIILLSVDVILRKHARATLRYWIWMLLVVKLLLPVSFSIPTGIGSWSQPYVRSALQTIQRAVASRDRAAQEPAGVLSTASSIPSLPEPDSLASTTKPVEVAAVGPEDLTWQGGVFLLWCAGVLILSGRMLQRWRFVKRLGSRGQPAPDELVEALDRCLPLAGMSRRIEIRILPNTGSPAVCGLLRPVILMPKGLLSRLSAENLKAVLLHELVHIQRGDLWLSCLQTVLQIVYFYNPLVWLANASVRRIREQAVDETVLVALGAQAESYGNTLIDIAEMAFSRVSPALRLVGVAESRKSLEGRIKHMVTRPIPRNARMRVRDVLVVVAIGAILLPMAAAGAGTPQGVPELPPEIAELFAMSKDDLVAEFGPPNQIFFGDAQYELDNLPEQYFMVYGDLALSFRVKNNGVVEITLLGPAYVFGNGVRVGDSEAKVTQAFGPDFTFEETPGKDFLMYEGLGLGFEVDKSDRTVMEINISQDYGDADRQYAVAQAAVFVEQLPEKIARLDIDSADLKRVKEVFGEPLKYIWGKETLAADDLPGFFVMVYPAGFHVFMGGDEVIELRHEGGRSLYVLEGGICVGSTVEEVLAVMGAPKKTVQGKAIDWSDSDTVLFRDIKGTKGHCYYHCPDQHLRLWFWNDKLMAIYMTRSDYGKDKDEDKDRDEPFDPEFARLLAQRVAQLDIDSADPAGVKAIFGEPLKYLWGNKTFNTDALPENYIMDYPCGFRVWIGHGRIRELRHSDNSPYLYAGVLGIGAPIDEAVALLGSPDEVVQGQENTFKDRVLYRDIDGRAGHGYYRRADQNVRLWFWNDKVKSIYMTRSDFD
ncbi:MAG: M56 family metallopeptidase [Phycisphaerales bacterium]|nr:MAG: M56 family metallopeptidase [Phycisphaerales bacterium]